MGKSHAKDSARSKIPNNFEKPNSSYNQYGYGDNMDQSSANSVRTNYPQPIDTKLRKSHPTPLSFCEESNYFSIPKKQSRDPYITRLPPTPTSAQIIQGIHPDLVVGSFLKKVPLFAHLTEHERGKLGGALIERAFPRGAIVLTEGEISEVFYIIKEGTASVLKMDNDKSQPAFLRELSEGDHFGESAILSQSEKLAASVRADTYLVLWSLDKTLFKKLFKQNRIDITFATRDALTGEPRGAVDAGTTLEHFESPIPKVDMSDEEKISIISSLKKNPIYKSNLFCHFNETHLNLVVQTMEMRMVKAGEIILREGTEGDILYVIREGEVDVFQKDKKTQEEIKVDHHSIGSSFGELALVHNAVRNATVIAISDVKVRELRRMWVTRVAKEIVLSKEANYRDWLNNVALLAPLTNADRARIAEALEVITITERRIIFRQGDKADGLYIVAEGVVSFSAIDTQGTVIEMKKPTLGSGEYFGERALMNNKSRAATATTDGPCKLLKLDREAFIQLLGPLEDVLKRTIEKYEMSAEATKWKPARIPFHELIIVGVLGRGSYGYVQLVKDKNNKTYALKAISKQRIVDKRQIGHTLNEKKYMKELDHPFLIKLYDTYKDRDRIYFLMEPSLGGELFPILKKMRTMTPRQAKFFAGQVILAFQYLHSKNLVYRDLKPENVLLDDQGYIKITDFGFLKRVSEKTYTMCGTPEYMAPEVISLCGHGKGVDWWTLGIFIFEVLASYSPFYRKGSDNLKMYERITEGHFNFPSHVDEKARSLISGLLQVKPHKRLGCLKGGAADIMNDKWFSGFDWQGLLWRTLRSPITVKVQNNVDLSNFKQTVKEKHVKPYVSDGTNWDDDF